MSHCCWDLGGTNSLTSARHGYDLLYIRIWATPSKRLFFWDGAPSLAIGISTSGAPLQWVCRQRRGVEDWSVVVGASHKACLPHAMKSWISIQHLVFHCEES